ncbi:hypothetical protein sscle_06g051070 [Sclerotinia sclerotiorum 1980 UF-70]|uniref:Uncharacterized protein n=1 Tax=Sclerotinia sclerotiorum (strain ATCC 18683 / 1980 / Ss-1) TaxID=665079 RepID=A0A1D9Q5X7_SCLS1|nr:hypothetical protein sscle_06g051070 [Sclerotinia sclerotiorum 1980 UF-70]
MNIFHNIGSGLTIIAVNLPSLWYYLAGVNPEHVLRTVRSVISLRSIRSGSQSSSKSANDFENKSGTGSGSKREQSLDTNSSSSYLTYSKGKTVEAYTMVDMAAQPEHQNNSSSHRQLTVSCLTTPYNARRSKYDEHNAKISPYLLIYRYKVLELRSVCQI